ncbi:hypothetical protein GEMRC1_011471 [Eukaryota sp. GEM-RC1]
MSQLPIIRVLILGDSQSGKSSLLYKLCMSHSHIAAQDPVPYCETTVQNMYKLEVWEPPLVVNLSNPDVIPSQLFQLADVIIITVDMTTENSINSIERWVKVVFSRVKSRKIMIVATKKDVAVSDELEIDGIESSFAHKAMSLSKPQFPVMYAGSCSLLVDEEESFSTVTSILNQHAIDHLAEQGIATPMSDYSCVLL